MNQIFISYSRKDYKYTEFLRKKLEDANLVVWVDVDELHASSIWWDELQNAIRKSIALIFIVSSNSINSEYCKREFLFAKEEKIKIIPIRLPGMLDKDVPDNIQRIHWRTWSDVESEQGFGKLVTEIITDFEWKNFVADLREKALQWGKDEDPSFLLHGKELQEAEEIIFKAEAKGLQLFPEHRQFISESRKKEDKRRRILLISGGVTALIIIFLSWFAINNNNIALEKSNLAATAQAFAQVENQNAIEQSKISHATDVASQAVAMRNVQFDLSLLLSIEAFLAKDLPTTRNILAENTQYEPQLVKYLSEHSSAVRKVVFNPDGKTFASGDDNGNVIIWDADTYLPINNPLIKQGSHITNIVYSPDGKMIAIAGNTSSVYLIDLQTLEGIYNSIEGNMGVSSMAFSADGSLFALGDYDGKIYVLDLTASTYSSEEMLSGHNGYVTSLAFSPDGKTLISGDETGQMYIWNVETFEQLKGLEKHTSTVSSLVFSPDGKTLVSAGWDNTIIFWDVVNYVPVGEPVNNSADTLYISADGKALGYEMGSYIEIMDIETRQLITTFYGNDWTVTSALSPDWKKIVSGGKDNKIVVSYISNIPQQGGNLGQAKLTEVVYDQTNKAVFAGGWDKTVYLWDTESKNNDQVILNLEKKVISIALSSDGRRVSAGTETGTFFLWNVNDYHSVRELDVNQNERISSLVFSPDGNMLATGFRDTVLLWDVQTGERIGQSLNAITVDPIVFSPEGKYLTTGSGRGIIDVWNISTQERSNRINIGESPVTNLAYSPDGKTLALGKWDYIILWDVDLNMEIDRLFIGLGGESYDLVFSPDGKTLAATLADFSIRLWETDTYQQFAYLTSNPVVFNLAFSPDSKQLAAGTCGQVDKQNSCILGKTEILDVTPQAWIENSCRRAGRNFTREEWARFFPNEEYRATCSQWPLEVELVP